jgi:hypothetical protein
MKIKLLLFSFLFVNIHLYSQRNDNFSKAVEKERFYKIGRLFERQVKRLNKIETNKGNFPYSANIDSLTNWLKDKPCVLDAINDKCQNKILIYPGHSTIGAKFRTKNGTVEKCFLIQEGTTGNIKIFKWRFHLFNSRNKLVYEKMYNCDGFVDRERQSCELLSKMNIVFKKPESEFIDPNLFLGEWESNDTIKEKILFFYDDLLKAFNLKVEGSPNYVFSKNVNNLIYVNGSTIAWPPMGCKIIPIDSNTIEIEYTDYGNAFISRMKYQRKLDVGK